MRLFDNYTSKYITLDWDAVRFLSLRKKNGTIPRSAVSKLYERVQASLLLDSPDPSLSNYGIPETNYGSFKAKKPSLENLSNKLGKFLKSSSCKKYSIY